jgi:hypothetical protein
MNQLRRFLTRGVFVPFALFALIVAGSVPASAAPLDTSAYAPLPIDPLSMNW